jgi:pimeloyl-ACP methyl ester carboxylesterase
MRFASAVVLVAVTVGGVTGCTGESRAAPVTTTATAGQATVTMASSHPYACAGTVCSGLVGIGHDRSMYLQCHGGGSPTVVLVSGLGERASNWAVLPKGDSLVRSPEAVYPQVGRFTRVCAYDRPGTSSPTQSGYQKTASTPVRQPVAATGSAADLAALLKASGEHAPFLLVGQSYGGDVVRMYADAHPSQTVGLVLVDALSEYLSDYLSPTQLADFEKLNSPEVQKTPAGAENLNLEATFAQLRTATAPTVPVTVLSADIWPITAQVVESVGLPGSLSAALWSAQGKAQARLAALFPGDTWVTKTNASHYIHLYQPQLVTNSIHNIITTIRKKPNTTQAPLTPTPLPPETAPANQ